MKCLGVLEFERCRELREKRAGRFAVIDSLVAQSGGSFAIVADAGQLDGGPIDVTVVSDAAAGRELSQDGVRVRVVSTAAFAGALRGVSPSRVVVAGEDAFWKLVLGSSVG